MIFGNITVPYPPETNPNEGGGPIRRVVGVATRTGDGMPPHGWPQMVTRTPTPPVLDREPGGSTWPGIEHMKFLPDGRLVPASALGAVSAAEAASMPVAQALARLELWFVKLQRDAASIIDNAGGKIIPCSVRVGHNRAVAEYMRVARAVFSQIVATGEIPRQRLYNVKGQFTKEIRLDQPVSPLTFSAGECGMSGANLGLGPLAIAALAGTAYVVGFFVTALSLRIRWPGGGPPPDQVKKYLECKAGMAAEVKAGRITQDDAHRQCIEVTPKPGTDWISVGIGLGVAALIVGGGVYAYRRYVQPRALSPA